MPTDEDLKADAKRDLDWFRELKALGITAGGSMSVTLHHVKLLVEEARAMATILDSRWNVEGYLENRPTLDVMRARDAVRKHARP